MPTNDVQEQNLTQLSGLNPGDYVRVVRDPTGPIPESSVIAQYKFADELYANIISPTILAADVDDYSPSGLAQANVLRLSSSLDVSMSGLTSGLSGRIVFVHNIGTFNIRLQHENANSLAANRFAFPQNINLEPNMAIVLQYDGLSSRWRGIGGAKSTGAVVSTPTTGTYGFDTTTGAVDPGAGDFAFNTGTPASITNIYISETDDAVVDYSNIFAATQEGDIWLFIDKTTPSNWVRLKQGAGRADNGTWWTIPVTYIAHNGTLPAAGSLFTVDLHLSNPPGTGGGGGGGPTAILKIDQSGGTGDTHGVLAGTINGTNKVFTVSSGAYVSGTLTVYLNGQLQTQGTGQDWTETSPATGTFTLIDAPVVGDEITAVYATTGGGVVGVGMNDFVANAIPSGSIDGANTLFTCPSSYVPSTLQVFRDGQLLALASGDLAETNPAAGTFTLTEAPITGSVLLCSYQHTASSTGNADTVDGFHASAFVQIPMIRELLTANRTYYVRIDGNDSNDGLTDSPSGAFRTIQKSIDVASALDSSIYNVYIIIGDGTYVENTVTLKNMAGTGLISIRGSTTTPTSVVIDAGFLKTTPGTTYVLGYYSNIKSAGFHNTAISSRNGAFIQFRDIAFGDGFINHIYADRASIVECAGGNYSIVGGASNSHITCIDSGIVYIVSKVIPITGTVTFGTFASSKRGGILNLQNAIYSGSVTGQRYSVDSNGVIDTSGGGANFLPGSVAGTATTGGQYL
jgi:hypothetical protein